MRILLVSGAMHRIMSGYASGNVDIVNGSPLGLREVHRFLQEVNPAVEAVLITDDAFSGQDRRDKEDLALFLERFKESSRSYVPVIFATTDFTKEAELASLTGRHSNFRLIIYEYLRIPRSIFTQAFEQITDQGHYIEHKGIQKENPNIDDSHKRKSFLDRFRSKPKNEPAPEAADHLTRELEKISRGISRVIAITGHRGSGLTSTAVNLAGEASKRALSAMIIDMDIEYRSTNMYFSRFNEQSNTDEDLNASLIRTLARPQDYKTTALNIKENLWLTALGYHFNDRKLLEQFYNSAKLVGLLSVLRNRFNLVILDMPMDLFKTFQETLIHIDIFGLCVPNNLHSVLSTLRNVEVVFDRENAYYLNAKSKVIVTKYNDRARFQGSLFTPDKVSALLSSGLSDHFSYEMKAAGHVPYSHDFDTQIETDIPAVNAGVEYANAYGSTLLRLLEGAK